jgi:hypothetical protein
LTTVGYKAYLSAVDDASGDYIDYAMLVKIHPQPSSAGKNPKDSRDFLREGGWRPNADDSDGDGGVGLQGDCPV